MGRLSEKWAQKAVEDLRNWPLKRVNRRALLEEAWGLRERVSAYDALYVALARTPGLGVPLLHLRL